MIVQPWSHYDIVTMNRQHDEHLHSGLYFLIAIATLLPSKVMGRCFFFFDSRVSTSGNFSSPGWPDPYEAGLRCTYVFQGEVFQAVRIVFQTFHLEEPYKAGCLSDYLDVTTMDFSGVRDFVGRFCGREVKTPILTLHSHLEMFLATNVAVQAQGFYASYSFVHEESVYPSATIIGGRRVCGGLVEGKGGNLVSPGYPRAFPGDLKCTWLLRARPFHHVYLRIQQLQLQGSIANCRRAELGIHDGYRPISERSRDSLKTFCGDLDYYRNQAEKVVLSPRNRLLVTFRTGEPSDNTTSMAGFLLIWTEVSLTNRGNCSSSGGFWCESSVHCVGVLHGRGGCIQTANFCIDPSLVCDGQPNCSTGDNTDEDHCGDVIMMVGGIAFGTLTALVAMSGAVALWLRHRRRLRRPVVSSSCSSLMVNSSTASQPHITSSATYPTTLPNNISKSDFPAEITWVEVSVPTPPPPPFLATSYHSKAPPSIAPHSPLPIHKPLIHSHSPLPPPNSPMPTPLTSPTPLSSPVPSPIPSPTLKKSSVVLGLTNAPSTYSLPLPSPHPPLHKSSLMLEHSPSPEKYSPLSASSPMPPPPSPQDLQQSPKRKRKSPRREVSFESLPARESPTSDWPALSPPPTPPPPPISDPMQSPWLAAIRVPTSRTLKREKQLQDMHSRYSSSREKLERPVRNSSEEIHVSTSDGSSSKSHNSSLLSNIQTTSTTSTTADSTKIPESDGSSSYRKAYKNKQDGAHQSCRKHSCSKRAHCANCPHRSAGCIHHLQNHSSSHPQGLVRSRSLPRHRTTRIQPNTFASYENHPWPLMPYTKRSKSCTEGWEEEVRDRDSPEGPVCFPCVSSKSRALSKTHVNIMPRECSNPVEKRNPIQNPAHECRHHSHHWNRQSQGSQRKHSRVYSSFELRS